MFAPYQLTDQQRADLRIMFPCNFPTTPSMQSMAERVRTFNNWHFTRATPQMHAEAGFFALGELIFRMSLKDVKMIQTTVSQQLMLKRAKSFKVAMCY